MSCLKTCKLGMQGSIARHPFPGYFGNSAGTTAYFLAYGSGVSSLSFLPFPVPGLFPHFRFVAPLRLIVRSWTLQILGRPVTAALNFMVL